MHELHERAFIYKIQSYKFSWLHYFLSGKKKTNEKKAEDFEDFIYQSSV